MWDLIRKNIWRENCYTVVCGPRQVVSGASGLSLSLLCHASPPKRRHLGNKARQPARHTTSTMWHPSGAVQCAWLPGNPPDSSIYRATNVIGVDVNWLSLDATVLYSVVDGCNVAPSLNNVLCIGLPPTCMFSSVGPSRRMTGRSKRVAPLCRIYTKTQL